MSLFLWRLCAVPVLLVALLAALPASAQTTLVEGDLAILAFDPFTNAGPEQFSFVLLTDVEAGTVIYFSDFDVAANGALTDDGFDGILTVTLNALSAGTVVTVNVGNPVVLADPSQGGVVVTDSGFVLSEWSGDSIVAYQGSATTPSGDDFLYYLNANESTSVAPNALGADAVVVFPTDFSYVYDTRAGGAEAPSSGTVEQLIAAFNTTGNYFATNGNIDPATYLPDAFTIVPPIHVSPVAITVNESGTMATFDVTLSRTPTADVTIDVSSSDPTEASISTTTLTFPASTSTLTQTVDVTGVDDAINDGDQTVTIVLDPAVSGDPKFSGLDPEDVTVTVQDDEIRRVALSATPLEIGEEGTTESTLTATLTSPAVGAVTVTLGYTGSATRNADYTGPDEIVIPDGATSASATVSSLPDDANEEGDEIIRVAITGVAGDAQEDGDQQVAITLLDNEPSRVAFAVVQQGVVESAGAATFELRLNRRPQVAGEAIVTLVSGDSADLGGFTSQAVAITPGGPLTYTLTIPVTDDAVPEANETFVFRLSTTGGVELGDGTVTALVVVDDDGEPVAVAPPVRDADGDGQEDGGPRVLALPVNGVTAAELAEAAGADAVFVLDPATGAFVEADPDLVLSAGQPVLVDVAPGADIEVTGTRPAAEVAYPAATVALGEDASRALVALGNPTDRPVSLDAVTVTGGTLADLALVFDPAAGAFRPVRIEGLGALALGPFDVVVLQVVPDGDPADVSVSIATDASASDAALVADAAFTPGDGETAVVLELRPTAGDEATAQARVEADAPGDTFVLRLLEGSGPEVGPADAVDLFAPGGGRLASPGPAGSEAVLAAEARDALAVGESVTVPLVVSVPEAGTYEIALANVPSDESGFPVLVEVFDGATATVVSDGAPFTFTADASMTGADGVRGRFAVRVSVISNVAAENDSPALPSLAVFPNPTAGRATVSLARASGAVRVAVYDALGRQVAQLHDGPVTADASWSVADLAPGVYLVRATGADGVWLRSFTVVR